MATPEDLVFRRGGVSLGGGTLDVLFRYYPLQWLAEAPWAPPPDAMAEGEVAMLPPAHTLIPQSKGFLALCWELEAQGFFPPAETAAIRHYVARTALGPEVFGRHPYVIKPYLEHEGRGVRLSSELCPRERSRLLHEPVVCQEQIAVMRAWVPIATGRGWKREARHLIFGVFLAGTSIAGIYTRAGGRITGREAVYTPTLTLPSPSEKERD